MPTSDITAGSLRTPSQELLLRAALLGGREALKSWEQWQSTTDLDHAPPGSYRLFPLISRNLEPFGTEYPDIGRLKGVRRRTWLQNQLLFRATADVLRSFHEAGIETMLLRGAALVTAYYQDAGVREMRNTDIFVPENQARGASRILRTAGWRQVNAALSAVTFRRSNDLEMRLHWHVLSCCPSATTDRWFWSASQKTQFQGIETHTLNSSDQILCSSLASLKWSYEPAFWRAADALTMLHAGGTIDPGRFLSLATEQRLTLPLHLALRDLRKSFGAPVPEELLDSLAAAHVSRSDRHELEFLTQPYRHRTPRAWITGAYRQHQRSEGGTFAGHLWRTMRWAVVPRIVNRLSRPAVSIR